MKKTTISLLLVLVVSCGKNEPIETLKRHSGDFTSDIGKLAEGVAQAPGNFAKGLLGVTENERKIKKVSRELDDLKNELYNELNKITKELNSIETIVDNNNNYITNIINNVNVQISNLYKYIHLLNHQTYYFLRTRLSVIFYHINKIVRDQESLKGDLDALEKRVEELEDIVSDILQNLEDRDSKCYKDIDDEKKYKKCKTKEADKEAKEKEKEQKKKEKDQEKEEKKKDKK